MCTRCLPDGSQNTSPAWPSYSSWKLKTRGFRSSSSQRSASSGASVSTTPSKPATTSVLPPALGSSSGHALTKAKNDRIGMTSCGGASSDRASGPHRREKPRRDHVLSRTSRTSSPDREERELLDLVLMRTFPRL